MVDGKGLGFHKKYKGEYVCMDCKRSIYIAPDRCLCKKHLVVNDARRVACRKFKLKKGYG